jgi:hypothetical protein
MWLCITPFGFPGGARGVDDHRHCVGIDRRGAHLQHGVGHLVGERCHVAPAPGAAHRVGAEQHDALEIGKFRDRQVLARLIAQPRQRLDQHGAVVDRAGAIDGDQRRAVRLRHGIAQIGGAIARVERHQHGADLRHGEQQEFPFRPVRHPQRDLLARRHAERHQRLGREIDLQRECAERPAPAREHQRLALRPLQRRPLRQIADALLGVPLHHRLLRRSPVYCGVSS